MLPLNNCYITSPYGIKRKDNKIHTGIDFISKSGDRNVKAIKAGVVRVISYDKNGFGNYVSIQHSDGIRALYCHLEKVYVKVGDKINEGDAIGKEGTTGNSTGIHLHLEIRNYPYSASNYVDISKYLRIKNESGVVKMFDTEIRYNKLEDVPDFAKPTIKKLMDKKILNGDEAGLNLSYDMIRMLVINDRVGLYD